MAKREESILFFSMDKMRIHELKLWRAPNFERLKIQKSTVTITLLLVISQK